VLLLLCHRILAAEAARCARFCGNHGRQSDQTLVVRDPDYLRFNLGEWMDTGTWEERVAVTYLDSHVGVTWAYRGYDYSTTGGSVLYLDDVSLRQVTIY
jgi:hypothetical protein